MKYHCRICLFKTPRRQRFVEHIRNVHVYDDPFFNSYDRNDTKISTFCCGIPFSSKFRLSYHIYQDHNAEQYGLGNNIRRVNNQERPWLELHTVNDRFITQNYTFTQSSRNSLVKKSYNLYTDHEITDGTARDTFIFIISKALTEINAASNTSIDYTVNFCKYENRGLGNLLVSGQPVSKVIPMFILPLIGRESVIDDVIRSFENSIDRVYLQGSGWIINRLINVNVMSLSI